MNWQPINSCPEEQSVLLSKWHECRHWIVSGFMEDGWIFVELEDEYFKAINWRNPTHWKYIPE